MEDILNYSRLIAVIVSALSFSFGVFVFFKNSQREKTKTTLNYWQDTSKSILEEVLSFYKDYPKVKEGVFERVEKCDDGYKRLHSILNKLEQLALGINLGAYDLKVLNRAAGKTILALYATLQPFIQNRNLTHPEKNSWTEFATLNNKLLKLRK